MVRSHYAYAMLVDTQVSKMKDAFRRFGVKIHRCAHVCTFQRYYHRMYAPYVVSHGSDVTIDL